jgi:hypothetical protein
MVAWGTFTCRLPRRRSATQSTTADLAGIVCSSVEAFESFVAVALEAEDLVVSPAVKFPVELKTARVDREEVQRVGVGPIGI